MERRKDKRLLPDALHSSRIEIVEQYVAGKHTEDDCEDGIVITPHFVAVADGSTGKTEFRINPDMSNGRYCTMLISRFIREMKPDISPDSFCREITAFISNACSSEHSIKPKHPKQMLPSKPLSPQDRPCASVVIYSHHHREIWMIGDCQCMTNGKLHENNKPHEHRLAEVRARVFNHCLSKHANMTEGNVLLHDYARDFILPRLIKAMEDQNKSYAVIDGSPIYKQGIRIIALGDCRCEVVLASDGYPFLKPSLEASEMALEQQLATDPFNIKTYKATKGLMRGNRSFDDRAYVRFRC